jgi:hypothetical protein
MSITGIIIAFFTSLGAFLGLYKFSKLHGINEEKINQKIASNDHEKKIYKQSFEAKNKLVSMRDIDIVDSIVPKEGNNNI